MEGENNEKWKCEDRIKIFISYGHENIAEKINNFLKENEPEIEKVIDIKLSTSYILSSSDTDNQMVIVTVLIHWK